MQNVALPPPPENVQHSGFEVSSAQSALAWQRRTLPSPGQPVGMRVGQAAAHAAAPLSKGHAGGEPAPTLRDAQQIFAAPVGQSSGPSQLSVTPPSLHEV